MIVIAPRKLVPIFTQSFRYLELLTWQYLQYVESLATGLWKSLTSSDLRSFHTNQRSLFPTQPPLSHFLTLKKEQRLQGCCKIPGSTSQCNSGEAGLDAQQVWSHYRAVVIAHLCRCLEHSANVECAVDLGGW